MSVSGESMFNRLEMLSLPRNTVVRLTDRRYMTEILLQRRKTQTQTYKTSLHSNEHLFVRRFRPNVSITFSCFSCILPYMGENFMHSYC